jgi:hypothetical protein
LLGLTRFPKAAAKLVLGTKIVPLFDYPFERARLRNVF